MQAQLDWQGGIAFKATADSNLDNGYNVKIDGPPAIGGQGEGFRPMEMVLFGLGGCTGVDFISILKKQRLLPDKCEIILNAERSENTPKIFTDIEITFQLHIHAQRILSDAEKNKIDRAAQLSVTKYCSVYAMLEKTVSIKHCVKYLHT